MRYSCLFSLNLRALFFLLFFFTNAIYIIKYSSQLKLMVPIALFLYVFYLIAIILFVESILNKFKLSFGLIYFGCVILFTLIFLLIYLKIPPNAYPVDRWSAITNFNNALMSGKFPYNEFTQLNNPISGLPGLFLIALPFQLIGDAGLLQIFTFISFSLIVFHFLKSNENRLITLILLATSPGFLWEILARSELFSNMCLFLIFTIMCEKSKNHKTFFNMILAGIVMGLMFSTRLILILPFAIYFFRYFRQDEKGLLVLFIVIGAFCFLTTIVPFMVWDYDEALKHNPLSSQINKSPFSIVAIFLTISVCLGYYCSDFKKYIEFSGVILFLTTFSIFLYNLYLFGWNVTIYEHRFDISYFQFSLPYLLLSLFMERDFISQSFIHHFKTLSRPSTV